MMESEWNNWVCVSCGGATNEVARVFCTNCRGYHDLCLACANDVEIPGENARVGDQIALLRGHVAPPPNRLAMVSVGGAGSFCSGDPVNAADA